MELVRAPSLQGQEARPFKLRRASVHSSSENSSDRRSRLNFGKLWSGWYLPPCSEQRVIIFKFGQKGVPMFRHLTELLRMASGLTNQSTQAESSRRSHRPLVLESLETRIQMSATQWVPIATSVFTEAGQEISVAVQPGKEIKIFASYDVESGGNHPVTVTNSDDLSNSIALKFDGQVSEQVITADDGSLRLSFSGADFESGKDQIKLDIFEAVSAETKLQGVTVDETTHEIFYDGRATRLLSYGDFGMVAEKNFNYVDFLDEVSLSGVNMTRVWVNYHWAKSLSPFNRVNKQGEVDSKGKQYDLGNFNQEYFGRLKSFVEYAESKGVVVQVTLFNGSELNNKTNAWPLSPYNPKNNVNFDKLDADDFGTNSQLWELHKDLIDKTAETLKDQRNVIYEIMNEPASHFVDKNTAAFHKKAVDYLATQLTDGVGSKVISVNINPADHDGDTQGKALREWALSSPKVGLVSLHLAPNTSEQVFDLLKQIKQEGNKAVLVSNDGDPTQMTYEQATLRLPRAGDAGYGTQKAEADKLDGQGRRKETAKLLKETFAKVKDSDGKSKPAPDGLVHFELLEKGLNGTSWNTSSKNYEVDASKIDQGVLNAIKRRSLAPNITGSPGFIPPVTAPQELSAINVARNSFVLKWDGQSDSLAGFDLQVSTDGVNYRSIGTRGRNASAESLQNLSSQTKYFLKVVAFDAEEQDESDPFEVTTAGNFDPTAVDDVFSTFVNSSQTLDVLANDADPEGDFLSLLDFTQPEHGRVERDPANPNRLIYTGVGGFTGDDSFTYRVADSDGGIDRGTVRARIDNRLPQANSDEWTTTLNDPINVNVLRNDSDPDGHDLRVRDFTQPVHGRVERAAGDENRLVYTPNKGFYGDDTFTYQVGDGHGGQAWASVVIHVTPPPVPNAPTNLDASSVASTWIVLNWRDRSAHEIKFRVEVSRDGANWEKQEDVPANGTTARIDNLKRNTVYYFRLVAINEVGQRSDPSNVIKIRTDK